MYQRFSDAWREYRAFLLLIALMAIFRSSFADWNSVPTGSMKPTIIEGDRIFINKIAYDLKLPFVNKSLLRLGDPERGDIVVFESAASGKRLVKRVIGLPGEVVTMVENSLTINGQPFSYDLAERRGGEVILRESVGEMDHMVRIDSSVFSPLASLPPVRVPKDHYLVLGDNRNNSADSRVIGFVPRSEILGRSRYLVASLDYENYFLPRTDRFLQPL